MAHIASNLDRKTVEGFGREWGAFDQSKAGADELRAQFDRYFSVFRWDLVGTKSVGFDLGCGSGRWARMLAPKVGELHCIDASGEALAVARRNLADLPNVTFHEASVDAVRIPAASMDFGVSLGVLHHVPDTLAAIRDCAALLKPGAPLLLYLYYRFDNRPLWFRAIWRLSDLLRQALARLPFKAKKATTDVLAALVYWPLARSAWLLEQAGIDVSNVPLAAYRSSSFYTMRTDSLDRFGTRLEMRFTRAEISNMLRASGCRDIVYSETEPYWVVCAVRA
jgi:SAM-dependent methyltransferase